MGDECMTPVLQLFCIGFVLPFCRNVVALSVYFSRVCVGMSVSLFFVVLSFSRSYNKPFWNAGSCNCGSFSLSDTDAQRASKWANPSTGVAHMFHTVGWGNWQFNIGEYVPGGAIPSRKDWGPIQKCLRFVTIYTLK